VIVGPSGSGKSTFLRCLNLLDEPTGGEILIDGQLITDKTCDINLVRQKMGMVFQHFNLFPHLTVRENITLAPLTLDLLNADEADKKALALLERVGVREKADEYPVKLSGGQKQRVAIARALATNPAIVLCDEPTGSLDYQTGKRIYALLRDLSTAKRKTVIVVTHNSAVGAIADRVIKLRDGRVTEIIRHEQPLAAEQLSW